MVIFLTVPVTEKSKVKALADLMSDQSSLSASHMVLLVVFSYGKRVSHLPGISFSRTLNPIRTLGPPT